MSIPSSVLGHVFIRKLSAFAGFSLLFYDFLLTLPLEVEHIWNAPWSAVKMLFLWNRYWTLLGQMFITLAETGYLSHKSERFCVAYTLFVPFFVIFSGESIRLLVAMRACVIFGCKRVVLVVWSILYVLYALIVLGIVLYFFIHVGPPHFEYLNETGICFSPVPPNLWTILFITIVLDSFIVFIVCFSLHQLSRGSRGVHPSRLMRLLARDAFLFYIATLFNSLLCIVCWTIYVEDPRNVVQQSISTPFLAIMGQRLVLNLRRLRARPDSTRDLSREVRRQMAAMHFTMDVHGDVERSDLQSDLPSDMAFELGPVGGR